MSSRRYNFFDVTLYRKFDDYYLNLTDFDMCGENEKICIEGAEGDYILIYDAFLNDRNAAWGWAVNYSVLSLENVMKMAGVQKEVLDKKDKKSGKVVAGKAASLLRESRYSDLLYAEKIYNSSVNTKRISIDREKGIVNIESRMPFCEGSNKRVFQILFTLSIKKGKIKVICDEKKTKA